MTLQAFCVGLVNELPELAAVTYPWQAVEDIDNIIRRMFARLDDEYVIKDNIAIHKSARVDSTATILPPAIIGPDCFVGAHSLLRGGVYLSTGSSIGPGCEVKHCLIGAHAALAHFNFVGDSVIGDRVNFEAGSIIANHYNERIDKTIFAQWDGKTVKTTITKFGACIGDDSKIGANAVTSPGTILPPCSVVRRLELIEQIQATGS